MSNQNKHIDLSDGLSEDIMLAYLHEELSNYDRHQVEKYLLDNPFEAEAMEGFKGFIPSLSDDMTELNRRLDQRIAKDEKKVVVFWSRPLQMAAAITVLLISSFLIFSILDNGLDTQTIVMEHEDDADSNLDKELGKKALSVPQTAESGVDSVADDNVLLENKEQTAIPKPTMTEVYSQKKPDSTTPKKVVAQKEPIEDDIQEVIIDEDDLSDDFEEQMMVDKTRLEEQEIASLDQVVEISEDNVMDEIVIEEIATVERKALMGSISGVEIDKKNKEKRFKRSSESQAARERSSEIGNVNGFSTSDLEVPEPKLISGTVYDDLGEPLPGVTVTIMGTTYGAITDIEGHYELQSQSTDDVILVGFIGYKSVEVEAKDSSVVDVTMQFDTQALEEVVVVGYGTQKTEPESYQSARPDNGFIAFRRYLKTEVRYPQAAKDNEITGKVLLQFDVATNGDLINLEIIKGLGYGCDEEAIRLITEGPRWEPSSRNGVLTIAKVRVKVKFEHTP